MIAAYKRFDGQALGSEKVGESSGENERIGDIPVPPQTTPKNQFATKPNHLLNKLHTVPNPPAFPSKINNFQKPVSIVSNLGNVFGGEKGEKPSKKPSEKPQPKPKPVRFHCKYCGRDGHKEEFCHKKKRDERMTKKWANKDRYHPSHGVPEPRMPLPRCEAVVHNVPTWGDRGFPT